MAEEEREELEENGGSGTSMFKKIVAVAIVILVASVAYLYMHIDKMNKELEHLASLNVYEQEGLGSTEVLGTGSDELDGILSQIGEITGWGVEIEEQKVKLSPEDGDVEDGYGFRYGAELGNPEIDNVYEDIRLLIEENEFILLDEIVEDLELPLVAFISYERDTITCTIVRLDIAETEASELEVGCYQETEVD